MYQRQYKRCCNMYQRQYKRCCDMYQRQYKCCCDMYQWQYKYCCDMYQHSELSGNTGAVVICISIKFTLRKTWASLWGIFCHCCHNYFVNVIFLYLHELVLLGTLCFSSLLLLFFFCFFLWYYLSVYKKFLIDFFIFWSWI